MKRILGALGVAALLVAPLTTAYATGFTLGDAAGYIVLYEGNAGKKLSINNFGTFGVWTGDIGIAGTGKLAASGPGTLEGDINFAAANTGQAAINNTTINGTVNYGVAQVQSAMNYMNSLSSSLGAVAGTALAISAHDVDQTVLASTGTLFDGNRLFSVSSVDTSGDDNLIIKSDGSENVVLNVNTPGAAQFKGNILLQDLTGKMYGEAGYAGLTPDQLLINLYAGAALAGGDDLSANNNGNDAHPANIMYGTFLNPNGQISFVNTRIVGHIFGGDSSDMAIVSGVTLTLPTNNVPDAGSTLALMGIGLGLLAAAKQKFLA